MKRILSIIMAVAVIACALTAFASCGNTKTDWQRIQEQGYFRVGYTNYAPMNYVENDELVGFDTEFAQLVAAELGVEVKFQLITWSQKQRTIWVRLSTARFIEWITPNARLKN